MQKRILVALLVLALALAVGCTRRDELVDDSAQTPEESTPLTESAGESGGQEAVPDLPKPPLAPAGAPIGEMAGVAHTGETIGVMIVASETDRAGAEARRQQAQEALGEFQTYFLIDLSDHYEGMTPGYWVVFEAYSTLARAQAAAVDNAPWLNSRGIDPYAKSATVKCADTFVLVDEAN
jgi:hypothetical protein